MNIIKIKNKLFFFWKIGQAVHNNMNNHMNAALNFSNYYSYKYGFSNVFSTINVNYMKKFYEDFPIYYESLNRLSFDHYKLLVDIKDIELRYFYFRIAMFCSCNVEELNNLISLDLYHEI